MRFLLYNKRGVPVEEKTERETIAENVRTLRAARDLTQRQLARLARLDLRTIRRIEAPRIGDHAPMVASVIEIAHALGTTIFELRGERVSLASEKPLVTVGEKILARGIEERRSQGLIRRVYRALRKLAGRDRDGTQGH